MVNLGGIGKSTFSAIHNMQELTAREKQRLVAEMSQVRGLMPLLMKRRNRQKWSREDKVLLAQHMKRLSMLSPYLMIMVIPGGFLVLPALAWWLDRRRLRERAPAADA